MRALPRRDRLNEKHSRHRPRAYLLDVGLKPEGMRLRLVFDELKEKGWADEEIVEWMHLGIEAGQ